MKPPVLGPKLIFFFYPVLLCLQLKSNFSILFHLCWFHFSFWTLQLLDLVLPPSQTEFCYIWGLSGILLKPLADANR